MNVLSAIEILKEKKPNFRNQCDALSLLIHCLMRKYGFRFVSLSEDKNDAADEAVPENWNNHSDVYVFRYKHDQSSMNFVLKLLVMGDKLLTHAFAKEDGKIHSIDLKVSDFVYENVPLDAYDSLFHHQDQLESQIKLHLINKLVPGMTKEGFEQETSSTQTTSSTQQRPPTHLPPYEPPTRSPLVDPSFQPHPLRIGRPGQPPFPFPIPGGSGFPDPDGYGNLIGPRHPDFHIPGQPPRGWGLPQPLPRGAVPPGARFDPFAPPPSFGYHGPDPDHDFPPPDHWYM